MEDIQFSILVPKDQNFFLMPMCQDENVGEEHNPPVVFSGI